MAYQKPVPTETIEGIQYLRGIAAMMVVFFHSRSYFMDIPAWTGIGARGVDIFFVISGFIMMYTTAHLNRDSAVGKESLNFLSKRIIRIVPLYWLALLWTASPYFYYWFSQSGSINELLINFSPELLTIFQDFAFIPHFSIDEDEVGEVFPIVIQGWTLNYEMFFYSLFAFGIMLKEKRTVFICTVLLTLVILGKLISTKHFYFLVYTQPILIEFVFGILVYQVFLITKHLEFQRSTLVGIGIIGFLLLNSGSSVNDKFVLAVAASIIVWVFIHGFRGVNNAVLKALGDASYSIYLFHAASFVGARKIIEFIGIEKTGYFNIFLCITIQVVFALIVCFIIYHLIEKPLLRLLRKGHYRLFAKPRETQQVVA